MIRLIIFIVISVGFFVWSWPFLRDPRSHGFFRFFAFEATVALILLNVMQWFQNSLSAYQIVSWVLLGVSFFMAVHGFYLLETIGKAKNYNIEETTALVMVGAYRYIRHPLYSSIFFMGWGVFLKIPLSLTSSLSWRPRPLSLPQPRLRRGRTFASSVPIMLST
jgi:hypothetical protein